MKKIKLDLDSVAVETFSVESELTAARRGTIAARVDTLGSCGMDTCNENSACICYPAYDTISCGECQGSIEIWSCAWTGCGNCRASENEVNTCYASFSCGYATPCM